MLVDDLHQTEVLEHVHPLVVPAVTGVEALCRAVQVEGLHAPRGADVGGHLLGAHLARRAHDPGGYAQAPFELFQSEQ